MRAEADAELARWTPELRQKAQALANKRYPSLKAALNEVLASEHRKPGHRERDTFRHPVETLQFFGLAPTMTVLEYGPGEGWYTEVLAPVLASRGKLIVTSADPKGPEDSRATLYAERLDRFLAKSPELYGKVERAFFDPGQPALDVAGSVDLALVIRGMHGWVRDDMTSTWLGEIHQALKPGGTLGIVQHRAAPGSDPRETAPNGYLPEAWVIEQVEAQGFKLVAKSEINANPQDTRDHEGGVWALPPNLRNGDKDRAKYQAIGESDRMTLRFKKVSK
jgi:predicted methyltransferase